MSLKKGLVLFLVLTFGVSTFILFSSVEKHTYEMIMGADKRGLLIALFMVILAWCFDALRFCAVARAASEKISFRLGLILTWLHYFGCAVTPMQTGGGPFQVYVLYKGKMPIGKGVAITLTRTLLTMLLLGMVVPLAVIIEPDLLKGHRILTGFFSYVVIFVIFSWFLVVISFFRPRMIKRWGQVITLLLKRIGLVKPRSVLYVVRRVNSEIDNYNLNFRLFFTTGLPHFIKAVVYSCFHLLFLFSVLPVLIWSLGLEVSFFQALLAQGVFLFVLYFVPTPGASGFAEGGGAVLFSLLVPWNIAGVTAIAWRFFTEYLAIFMGAMVAIKMLGWGMSEEIFRKDREQFAEED